MTSAVVPVTARRIPSPPPVSLVHNHYFASNSIKSSRFFHWSVSRTTVGALRSKYDDKEVVHVGDFDECSGETQGVETEDREKTAKGFSSKELLESLKRYGVAGVLSYGLLNTIYYLTAFFLVWFYFAPASGRMGYAAAVKRFLKVMAMVWAGSQVTKIMRAGGALALAPFVDKGLSWFTIKFKFKSKGKAFAAIAGMCLGLAVLVFFGLTLLWA